MLGKDCCLSLNGLFFVLRQFQTVGFSLIRHVHPVPYHTSTFSAAMKAS